MERIRQISSIEWTHKRSLLVNWTCKFTF